MPTFADTKTEELFFQQRELSRFNFSYVLSFTIANSVNEPPTVISEARAILTIADDADFLVESISGCAFGPTNSTGYRLTEETSQFLAAGCTGGRADRGVGVKISEMNSGVVLTRSRFRQSGVDRLANPADSVMYGRDYVALESLISPGYGLSFYKQAPFCRYLERGTKLLWEFRNRDTGALAAPGPAPENTPYHFVNIALTGSRFK